MSGRGSAIEDFVKFMIRACGNEPGPGDLMQINRAASALRDQIREERDEELLEPFEQLAAEIARMSAGLETILGSDPEHWHEIATRLYTSNREILQRWVDEHTGSGGRLAQIENSLNDLLSGAARQIPRISQLATSDAILEIAKNAFNSLLMLEHEHLRHQEAMYGQAPKPDADARDRQP